MARKKVASVNIRKMKLPVKAGKRVSERKTFFFVMQGKGRKSFRVGQPTRSKRVAMRRASKRRMSLRK